MNKELFIVVLNWNGWNYTKPCLESIKQEPFDNYTIILVDNGSDKKKQKRLTNTVTNIISINYSLPIKRLFLKTPNQILGIF